MEQLRAFAPAKLTPLFLFGLLLYYNISGEKSTPAFDNAGVFAFIQPPY